MSRFYTRLLFADIPALIAVGILPHISGVGSLIGYFVCVVLCVRTKWQLGDFHD